MIEELKMIAEIFKTATDSALYAYVSFMIFKIISTAIVVFPILSTIKYLINKVFIGGSNEDK